ncbi:hypothetical protein [Henriciella aquimarina]|uniref:hypothetical protein n=1 Tax=Henriciella aquimarina TaxID=545261 RepID=UPI000A01F8E3|nr:hypothetical protein [Henriciella aquimarina]
MTIIDVDWKGNVVSVISGPGVAIDSRNYLWRIETRGDPAKRIKFSADVVRRKLEASIETLETSIYKSKARDAAVSWTQRSIDRLDQGDVGDTQALLGLEVGAASNTLLLGKAWNSPEKYKAVSSTEPLAGLWPSEKKVLGSMIKNMKESERITSIR